MLSDIMKSLNAKRIAAVAAGLLVGLAVASQGVTYGNIPIINSAGTPVVRIVVGSTAQPSDGVVAANIAAVIGSLAHTSSNITATVSGRSSVSCVVTTPTCTLTNQQVWLGEKGLVVPTGSYSFSALIGSVLNGGELNSGNLQYTKKLQGSGSQYTYPESASGSGSNNYAITTSPTAPSAYTGVGISPASSVVSSTNGGGLQFTRFSNVTTYDNIVRLTSSQVPGLLSGSGTYSESEYLWLAGFPVYNQESNVSNFDVLDANGAYQLSFGKPIQNRTSGSATNAQINLLGENWTTYNFNPPVLSGSWPSSNSFVVGGNLTLAAASTPLTTVYVGHNISSGPFTVVLNDLSYPNNAGLSNAALSVYYNGVLTNVTAAGPASGSSGENVEINATGHKLFIKVSQTFPGLYAYQKWAKIQLFSNTFNVTSGHNFNTNNGNNWVALLRWTSNESSAPGTQAAFAPNAALQGIILYTNQSDQLSLTPGSTMNFITTPAVWKLTFVGDSAGAPGSGNSNYDSLALTTSSTSNLNYQNNGGSSTYTSAPTQTFSSLGVPSVAVAQSNTINDSSITEPVQYFTVSSSLPTAFQVTPDDTYTAPSSNLQSMVYNLDSYKYTPYNAVNSLGNTELKTLANYGLQITLLGGGSGGIAGNYVSSTNPLTVSITGYKPSATTTTTQSVTFQSLNSNQFLNGTILANLTNIGLGYALPAPGVTVNVYQDSNTVTTVGAAANAANSVLLGALTYLGPRLSYKVSSYPYYIAPNALSSTVTYTGEQNNVGFTLSVYSTSNSGRNQYFTYNMPEITVQSSSTPNANVMVGITNSSSMLSSPEYWLNYSLGNNNAETYLSSQGASVKAIQGFRTERGGDLGAVSTTSITYYEPRSVDGLQFVVGPGNTTSSTSTKEYGPYGVGQSTNIANVTIAAVNAICTFSTTSCTVTGLNNLTATPSVSQAVVATKLDTATAPLAVLDSQAGNTSALIVVGSKYVNSVAAQIFSQNPTLDSSFGSSSVTVQAFGTNRILVAGYTANQTVQAGNLFIEDLLGSASQ